MYIIKQKYIDNHKLEFLAMFSFILKFFPCYKKLKYFNELNMKHKICSLILVR